MSKMMRNVGTMGCKCCNSWEGRGVRQRDKREACTEVREEAPFIPIWIDPRYA